MKGPVLGREAKEPNQGTAVAEEHWYCFLLTSSVWVVDPAHHKAIWQYGLAHQWYFCIIVITIVLWAVKENCLCSAALLYSRITLAVCQSKVGSISSPPWPHIPSTLVIAMSWNRRKQIALWNVGNFLNDLVSGTFQLGQNCMEMLLSATAGRLNSFAKSDFLSRVQFHSSLSLSKSEVPRSPLVFVHLSSGLVQEA